MTDFAEHTGDDDAKFSLERSKGQVYPAMRVEIRGVQGFQPPPLDGSLNLVELMEWHRRNSPDWVWCTYRLTGQDHVRSISWKEAYSMTQRGARYFAKATQIDLDAGLYRPSSQGIAGVPSGPIVAVVANLDTLNYFVSVMSLIRIGLVPFAISINNSREAIAHLIKASNVSYVLHGPPGAAPEVDANLNGALEDVSKDSIIPKMLTWPSETLYVNPTAEERQEFPDHRISTTPRCGPDDLMAVLHSSGSTSFPKAVPFRHRVAATMARYMWYGDTSLVGKTLFLGHLPIWHAFAFAMVLGLMGSGQTAIVREPTFRPQPISPPELLRDLDFFKPDIFLGVPAMYRAWSFAPSAISVLTKIGFCINGGGPIDPEVAYKLKAMGVRLNNAYGATEALMSRFPVINDDPVSIELADTFMNIILRPQSDAGDNDIFEILVGCNEWYQPNVLNETMPDGQKVYATKDLIKVLPKKKPSDSTFVHCIGRLDDQIMHSTGEKTNPGPLVHMVQSSPLVRDVVYFGRQHPHVGALVEPSAGQEIDPSNEDALASFRNAIWPAVEKANRFAPIHSVLFKEMILVTDPAQPLPRTAKGSVRTGLALEEYAEEIKRTYAAFENIGKSDVQVPKDWTEDTVLNFIRNVVYDVLGKVDLGAQADDEDLFSLGVNSLNATKIRNVLASAVSRAKGIDGLKSLGPNFVYANPTIRRQSCALLSLYRGERSSRVPREDGSTSSAIASMEGMLEKYSHNWSRSHVSQDAHESTKSNGVTLEVALVTGTTGGLGAHLLALLEEDEHISRIYAVNRSSSTSTLLQRQRHALSSRGLDPDLASSPKVRLIEADLTQPQLGLEVREYEEIRDSITFLVHNSWTLNFNLSLASFESHIRGSRALIDLALASPKSPPPAFLFTSSVGVLSNPPAPAADSRTKKTIERHYDLSHSASASGYGQSKAVTEHILWRASGEAGLPVANLRIGQLSGSTTNGAWATTDWVPLIVQSAKELGCLPAVPNSKISWLPTDEAARVVLDLRHDLSSPAPDNESAPRRVFHIVHPRTTQWDDVFKALAKHLSKGDRTVGLVPFSNWVAKLVSSQSPPDQLPTKKLQDFFTGMAAQAQQSHSSTILSEDNDDEREAMTGGFRLDTQQSEQRSKALASLAPLDAERSVKSWLRYWQEYPGLDFVS